MTNGMTEAQAKEALANCTRQEREMLRRLAQGPTPSEAVRLLELKAAFPSAQLVENLPEDKRAIEIGTPIRHVVRSPELAQEATDEAIARVDERAQDEWKEAALKAVEKVCRLKATFTPDDIWEYVDRPPMGMAPQALGPVMQRARGLKWCIPTGQFVPSTIPSQHKNPIREWKSLLVPEEGTLL
jgi:hypothetical protein